MPDSAPARQNAESRQRVTIERIEPQINCGRFPAKRIVGDLVSVEADIFADGHDVMQAVLKHWDPTGQAFEDRMELLENDRWQGHFTVTEAGRYRYRVEAWIDHFETWLRDLRKKVEAGQDVTSDLSVGAQWVEQTARRVPP